MNAPEVKQFINDDNMRKTLTSTQKLKMPQQDAMGGSYLAQSRGQNGVRYNLNDTMPLAGSNFNLLKQADSG